MRNVWYISLLFLLLVSCGGGTKHPGPVSSVYYWRTTLTLDSAEHGFLSRHGVSRMYLRYFDVVVSDDGRPVPNATLSFVDSLPRGVTVIPVVYILNDCMRGDVAGLPQLLLKRVLQMSETNDVGRVTELQVDCDWTMQTQQRYFSFLRELRRQCGSRGIRLTATIRLHQLCLEPPPVDGGVLMVYNTGDVTRLDESKPILDMNDVAPYLRHIARYRLPLSAAYPLFRWEVLFRGGRFVGILHGDDLPVIDGDSIVVRQPSLGDILAARRAVGELRPDANGEVILYDLSSENIQRFKPNDYRKIYGKKSN